MPEEIEEIMDEEEKPEVVSRKLIRNVLFDIYYWIELSKSKVYVEAHYNAKMHTISLEITGDLKPRDIRLVKVLPTKATLKIRTPLENYESVRHLIKDILYLVDEMCKADTAFMTCGVSIHVDMDNDVPRLIIKGFNAK